MIREISVTSSPQYPRYTEFNLQAHSVVDLFMREISYFECARFTKIAVKIHDVKPRVQLLDGGNVLLLSLKEDLDFFFTLNVEDRKYWILKKLYDGLIIISKKYKLDIKEIKYIYQYCLALQIRNTYYHKVMVFSKNRRKYGLIFCSHEPDAFIIYAHIYNENGIIEKKEKFISTEPYAINYQKYLGKVKSNGNEIVLYNHNDDEIFKCPFE